MLYMQVRAGLAIAVFGLFGRSLGALGPVAHLPIANKIIAPDGFTRDTVLAGGQFPGPLIAATKGDNFRITVIDQLKNATLVTPTSIHWHGLFQHTTAWADGPAFVTQCPIVTGDSFLYNFNAPGQAGTFWYHSHISTQYCDGLRGPLVIYDPEDPYKHLYDVDDESTIITLGDWYHLPAAQVPVPARSDSTVINGLGRFLGGPLSPLAVIDVVYGKRYRFRLLNVACNPNYIFSIDGHNMTIIEADGQNTHPVTVDSLQIFVAQRYSFILEANQPVGNYWIRANPNEPAQMGFANGINSAILRYHGAPDEEPTTTQPTSVALLKETDLHPLENPAAPGKPQPGGGDVNLNLNLGFNNQTGLFSINGAPFVPPTVPVMLQILSGNVKAQSLLPPGSVYNLPLNSVIEVSIPGGVVNEEHPFHLHGHAFSVVRSAGTTKYNYVNPVRRDTVNIGLAGDNVTIRFVTDNPGPWFLHCHIDFHLVAGLAIVFAEDAPDIAAVNPVPEAWKELCPKYDASLNH